MTDKMTIFRLITFKGLKNLLKQYLNTNTNFIRNKKYYNFMVKNIKEMNQVG